MIDSDIERLKEMRRLAEALDARRDPLLAGLAAQLLGAIDALFNIVAAPRSQSAGARVQETR